MGIDELGCGFCFGIELFSEFCIEFFMYYFDCDDVGKIQILSLIDGCYFVLSDFGYDFVVIFEGMIYQGVSVYGYVYDYVLCMVGEEGVCGLF